MVGGVDLKHSCGTHVHNLLLVLCCKVASGLGLTRSPQSVAGSLLQVRPTKRRFFCERDPAFTPTAECVASTTRTTTTATTTTALTAVSSVSGNILRVGIFS